jgi:hypothetical protein
MAASRAALTLACEAALIISSDKSFANTTECTHAKQNPDFYYDLTKPIIATH